MEVQEFKERILPTSQRIYQFALRILRNEHDAEDVVQEIFMRLWDNRDELEVIKSIEAYSFRMTRNLCLDKLKKMKPRYYDDREPDSARYEEADPSPDPERSLELKDTRERLNHIIKTLPEQQQTLLQLRDIEGFEYDEISEITGMEINAIRVGISRARKKLKETIYKAQLQ
jgi:RNA polymerase sigma factor (sigma-70 family)